MSVADLLHAVCATDDDLSSYMDVVDDEIHDATIAGNDKLASQLTSVLTRLTLLAAKYDRRQITAIDDSQEVVDAIKQLSDASTYMDDVIKGNKKVADTLGTVTTVLGALNGVANKFIAKA
jgi:hypothetical protein